MATSQKCCKLADLCLEQKDSGVFSRSQWKGVSQTAFVIYRVVAALYMFAILIAYLVEEYQKSQSVFIAFSRNLGFIAFVLYVEMAGIVAVIDGWFLRAKPMEERVMGVRHKIHWVLFNITMNSNIVISIKFWTSLYDCGPITPFFYDFHVHALPSIISIIDLFLTAVPVRFLHVIYPMLFDLAYLIMILIYWAVGGMGQICGGDSIYIYTFLDYSHNPGLAAGVSAGILFVVVPVMQGIIWGLYKLRMFIVCRYGASNEDDQQYNNLII